LKLAQGTAGSLGMDFTHTFATFDDLKIMDLTIVHFVQAFNGDRKHISFAWMHESEQFISGINSWAFWRRGL
jgi:hypothetical protein